MSGEETFYSKEAIEYYLTYGSYYFDLRENLDYVTDEYEISNETHSAYIYQTKVNNRY